NRENEALQAGWREMARQFNGKIVMTRSDKKKPWSILALPTGTGKTVGLCLYCSMLGGRKPGHPGVLIVTNLKAEAKRIQNTINDHLGEDAAFAYNGDTKKAKGAGERRHKSPFLIVTHNAFKLGRATCRE